MKASRNAPLLAIAGLLWFGLPSVTLFSEESAPSADSAKWNALVAKKLKLPAPAQNAIICIGSSHMALWSSVAKDLAPLSVFNMGIGGSKMKHAADLFVPKLVVPFNPRAVILYEGSNDLAGGLAPEALLEDFKRLCARLHAALPDTRLYVLGIVPSPGKRFERWDAIREANSLLEAACAQTSWIRFLDTTTPLLTKGGKPREECFITNDVHMTPAGYEAWTSVVAPALIDGEIRFETTLPSAAEKVPE